MYAGPADLVRPTSWADAVRALQDGGDAAKAIAGGQSLIPMMGLRLATPSVLIDLSGAAGPGISVEGDRLVLSALTRHADLERSAEVAAHCPILAEAARLIGNIRVRHRGTIGGSLAHADPTRSGRASWRGAWASRRTAATPARCSYPSWDPCRDRPGWLR